MTRSLTYRITRRHGGRIPTIRLHIPMVSAHSDRLRAAACGPPCQPILATIDGHTVTALIR